ncbi:MAG: hypothetical protein HC794_06895 [Nitrospiraceae bacterium]|nr:hypothetical protein [Nitrospiraceae bacterium]
MSRQTKRVGDWIVSSPTAKPGGWYFQFENELYPDVDDSAVVLMALSKLKMPQLLNWKTLFVAACSGWSPCRGPMAAGGRTTRTTTGSSSTTSLLLTTTRCSIPARPTWRGGVWKCWPRWVTIVLILPSLQLWLF